MLYISNKYTWYYNYRNPRIVGWLNNTTQVLKVRWCSHYKYLLIIDSISSIVVGSIDPCIPVKLCQLWGKMWCALYRALLKLTSGNTFGKICKLYGLYVADKSLSSLKGTDICKQKFKERHGHLSSIISTSLSTGYDMYGPDLQFN